MTRPPIYQRPAGKPMTLAIKPRDWRTPHDVPARAAPAIVDAATECHVTPPDVAARMVRYLGQVGDFLTLEPSAGTGSLARALLASGHSEHELVMVERHIRLAAGLYGFGAVNTACFLEWAEERAGKVEFPRVIMNPPFSEARRHVAAALSLMGRGGHSYPATLVAIVPATFRHDHAETLESLPPGTVPSAPSVSSKIIRITR